MTLWAHINLQLETLFSLDITTLQANTVATYYKRVLKNFEFKKGSRD